jgi:hypothetical protein
VILNCNFEELRALATGAELILSHHSHPSVGGIVAPSAAVTEIEQLVPRLVGDLTISTLAEQRMLRKAIAGICEDLHDRLEEKVVQLHPAHEEAVSLYFDYAHTFAVLNRLDQLGAEMRAVIELTTGQPANDVVAATYSFPD